MLNQEDRFSTTTGSAYAASSVLDVGLRAHMLRIYNHVAAGLAISGLTAFAVYSVSALLALAMNPMVNMVLGLALIAFLWFGMNPNKMMQQTLAAVQVKYYAFTVVLGFTLAPIFLAYAHDSVARVFFITAAMFAGMSLYGYTTKRDLTGMSTFLVMGVWGLFIAMIVNMFLGSTRLAFVISVIGVLVFTGLIAFETQNAKRLYNESYGEETNRKLSVFSALGLYMNFVNLFLFLLRLVGGGRN